MHRVIKTRVKKYLLTVLILVICVTLFSNSSFFEKPVKNFANVFSKHLVFFVLPRPIKFNQAPTSATASTTVATTKSPQEKTQKTVLTDASEKGGKVISQTIDKSGSTSSFGDVYIKNKTEKSVDIQKALSNKPTFNIKLNSKQPQVLIVHTHATECFFPSLVEYYPTSWGERDTDTNKNMISIGKIIKNNLNKAGINTVQSEILHDKDSYTLSYDNSRKTIESYLKKYPSIKVVFDIHRDAINQENGDKIRPIIDIGGKTAAQIMLISGCESGEITNYPNWQKNFRFSASLQRAIEQTYPSLARPLFFAEKKYNQDLCENSCLIEVGSQANLLSEAKYSAELLSKVLVKYLKNKI